MHTRVLHGVVCQAAPFQPPICSIGSQTESTSCNIQVRQTSATPMKGSQNNTKRRSKVGEFQNGQGMPNGPPPRIPAVSIMVKIFARASKCWIRSGETSNALSDRLTGGLGMTRAKTAPVIQWQQTSQDTKAHIHPQTTKLKNLEVAMQQSPVGWV